MTKQEATEIIQTIDTLITELNRLRDEVEQQVVPFEPPYTVTE